MAFNPNASTLADCLARVTSIKKRLGMDHGRIFTSRDVGQIWTDKESIVSNIPTGFYKVMLPFATSGPATFYISSAGPGVKVPRHSHDEGDGIRLIISGSIVHEGKELLEGDWMYLPAKAQYEFVVGPRGVSMFYCYQCCCAQFW
jgi:hypothetical protein